MKINYNILWFEDREQDMDPERESISNFLETLGFKLAVEFRSKINLSEIQDLAKSLRSHNKYDLILIDFDLGSESEKGDVIAKKLRTQIYTDMVFYSGSELGKLRKQLYDNEIVGVFIASRPTLYDDIVPLLEDQSKKYCNLSTMRGAILEEVSMIDIQIRNACRKLLNNGDDDLRTKTLGKIKAKINENYTKIKHYHDTEECPGAALCNFEFVSFDQARVRLRKLIPSNTQLVALLADDGPVKSIQDLRNNFAHKATTLNADGTHSLEGIDTPFNFDKFLEIRKQLLTVKSQLDPLLESL